MAQSPKEIIAEKGVAALASALGERPATVRMWKLRNAIPRARWPEITQAFPDLTQDRLLEIEKAA